MAGKRTATSELDHTNWDAEEEPEERGVFRTASKEELQKRVIRTGRRRIQPGASSTQDRSSIFSGFSGFNKTAPPSFEFLSKLTNGAGSNTTNGSSASHKNTSPLGLFSSSPIANSTTIINSSPGSDTAKSMSIFGSQTQVSSASSLFGSTSVSQATSNSKTPSFGTLSTRASASTAEDPKPTTTFGTLPKNSSPVSTISTPGFSFGIPSNSPADSTNKQMKLNCSDESKQTISSNISTPLLGFKLPTGSSLPDMFNCGSETSSFEVSSSKKTKSNKTTKIISEEKNTQYYSKLKGLNESVSEWIGKHVNENPLCLLTPIFKDYEKYLKELEEEHKNDEISQSADKNTEIKDVNSKLSPSFEASIFTSNSSSVTAGAVSPKPPGFPLGSGVSTSKPFSFVSTLGATSTTLSSVSTNFSFNSTTTTTAPAPFSFGIGKQPFTLSTNATKPPDQTHENKDEDDENEPPKEEFTPIAEENSVYDQRCKIFVKKDNNFVDKGVGTLYIKTIENSSKHQLIVRANTIMGTVLLNLILNSSIPIQRMGKNNVMVVCIPTPDATPPPVSVLIRVKTSEEADNLLETLNKYKK